MRLEHSDEIADEPAWQYGVSVSWRVHRDINLLADYLLCQSVFSANS